MKRLIILAALIGFAMLGFAQDKKASKTTTETFAVNLHCDGCVNKVMKNLPYEKGVKDVVCDLAAKTVTVTYNNTKTNHETLKKSLQKLDFVVGDPHSGCGHDH